MEGNLTDRFLNRLKQIRYEPLPPQTFTQACMVLLDFLGVTYAGASIQAEQCLAYLGRTGSTKASAPVLGLKRTADPYSAVLLNGMNAHVAELDDGHRTGMLHLASPILPALLIASQQNKIGGEELLRGIVTGYEAAIRLACVIQPYHRDKGYHTTGTCGTIGAALAVASALECSEDQTKAALSAAVSSAAGILELQENNSTLKPFNAGRASLDGYTAAMIGRAGFCGPADCLGGKRGFLAVYGSAYDERMLCRPYDDAFGIQRIYMKPYASCRHSHSAVEAALRIRAKAALKPADILAVRVYTYKAAVTGHDHREPTGPGSARMSIPFSVALALVTGDVSIDGFGTDTLNHSEINELLRKVTVTEDAELTKAASEKRAAVVEIEAAGNRFYKERVDYAKGDAENPMIPHEVEHKFFTLARFGGKTDAEAKRVMAAVRQVRNNAMELYNVM
jgi:2-methylcitrate dehydratase PrpD